MLRGLPGQGHEDQSCWGGPTGNGSGRQSACRVGPRKRHLEWPPRPLTAACIGGALVDGRQGVTGHPLDRRRAWSSGVAGVSTRECPPGRELIGGALGDEAVAIDDADPLGQRSASLQY